LIKLAVTAGGIVLSLLMLMVFSYPLNITILVVVASLLSVFAVLRDENSSKQVLIALDLLFMLLILLVLGMNGQWEKDSINLFLLFISVSSLAGSLESIIFANRKRNPFLNLIFTVLFWAPLAIPIYYIISPKGGSIGGIAGVAILLVIVFRDIKRRKKEDEKEN